MDLRLKEYMVKRSVKTLAEQKKEPPKEIRDNHKQIDGKLFGDAEAPMHPRVERCETVPLETVNQETCLHEAHIIKKGGVEIGLSACVHCGFKGVVYT